MRGHTVAEAGSDQNFLAPPAVVSLGASAGRMLRSPEKLVMSAQPCRVSHPNTGRQGAAAPVPSRHPSPHMPLFTLPTHPPPQHPTTPSLAGGRSSLCSPRTEPDIKGAQRGQDEPGAAQGWGVWLAGLGQEAQQKRPETKSTEQQAGDDLISRQAFLPPGGNTGHMAGGNNRPFFLPSPAEHASSGEEKRGERETSLPEGPPA